MNNRKVILYIACSVDGYIADNNNDISFLDIVSEEGEDYGYTDFIDTVDTVIMGKNTYDKVLSFDIPFPHSDKQCFVVTNKNVDETSYIKSFSGDLIPLINLLKSKDGKYIFIDGGANIINQLLNSNLIDEFIISIIPIILGKGISLFGSNIKPIKLELIETKSFTSSLVQVHYKRNI